LVVPLIINLWQHSRVFFVVGVFIHNEFSWIDPIHLGIIFTVNMEVGMITPPVGLNLYVASGIPGGKAGLGRVVPISEATRPAAAP
jgi:TRAP-type C4-dicarboxylate transport system permease large subunit